MHFRNLQRLVSFQNIQLTQFLFAVTLCIIENVCIFDNTGANLDHRIFTDERIYDRLEYIGRFCFREIIVCFKDFICLLIQSVAWTFVSTREISNNIIQKVGNTSQFSRCTHTYRHDTSILHIRSQSSRNLCDRKLIPLKVTIHELFTRLCYRFQKNFTVFIQIFLRIFRYRAFLFAALVDELTSGFLDNVYISYKFTILADREMKRSNSLAIKFCQILNNLTVADIILIHTSYKNHSRKFIFLTDIPCFLCSNLNTSFAGDNNHCSVGCAHALFHLTNKIEITRSI